MKAIVCKAFGPPESLVLEDAPSRPLGKNEVRIAVKAAGVNFPDTLIIQGKYQFQPELPFIPGNECSGVIEAVGAKVSRYKPGDAVIAAVGASFRGALRDGDIASRLAGDEFAFLLPDASVDEAVAVS